MISRRQQLSVILLLFGLLLVSSGAIVSGQEPVTVKIGVLNPTTGSFAVFGEQANQGIQLYFDNHTIDGVNVELIFADTAGDPQQALEQARRLVEQEQVDLLLGLINSAVAVPLAQYADESETPLVISIAGARAATDGTHPYVVRTALANGQQDGPLGWYTATQLEKKNAALFAWDFIVGAERAGAFAEAFTAAGGTIVTEQKPPLGTTDYGPFISQVDPESIDVAYAFFAGPGAISFAQQMREFGFTPDIQVVAPGYFTAGVLGAMGSNVEGLVQADGWVPALDNPKNMAFLELFDSQVGGEAGVYVEESYTAAEVTAHAIEAVGGDMSDKAAFMEAVRALSFDSVAGPFSFDETGQSVRNVYVTQVVMNDAGAPVQQVLDTIESVGLNWSPEAAAAESESVSGTVKIGILTPTTGSLASNGEDVNTGIRLYFDSISNLVGNTQIELVFADTAANSEQALEQARRLIEQEQVDFLMGIVSSSVAVPIAELVNEQQIPLIVAVAGGTPVITGPDRSPYVFRTGITTGQLEPPFAWYVAKELGYSRAATFAWDFGAGHARADAFKSSFAAAGGEVVNEQWPPVGTTDFGPFIGLFNPDEVDVVYAYFAGPGAIAFVNQMSEFGITPNTPLVGPGFLTEFEVLPSMGDSAVGIVSATHYTPVADNAANQAFISLYHALKEDESLLPGTYIESGYLAALVSAQAVQAVGGNLSDTQAFLDALQALQVEGPGGMFSFDDHGQGIRNVYIIEVVKDADGNVTHQVISVLENVTQDWTPPQ